jgi:ABC-type transport system involved in cytochrome c biogenesis permease subunit
MKLLSRFAPWLALAAATLFLVGVAWPPRDPTGQMQFHEFGKIPVVKGGRVQPMDTLARNSLLVLSGHQDVSDPDGHEVPPEKWLLDVMTCDRGSRQQRMFRIEDPELQKQLGLEPNREDLFSLDDLGQYVHQLMEVDERAEELRPRFPDDARTRHLFNLAHQVRQFATFGRYATPYKVFKIDNDQLLAFLDLKPRRGLRYAYTEFVDKIPDLLEKADAAAKKPDRERDVYDNKLIDVSRRIQLYVALARREGDTLRLVPPAIADEEWRPYPEVEADARKLAIKRVQEAIKDGKLDPKKLGNAALRARAEEEVARARAEISPSGQALGEIFTAYENHDTDAFNRAVAAYRQQTDEHLGGQARKVRVETLFNHFEPFYQCAILYAGAVLLICGAWCGAWVGWMRPLSRAAFWLLLLVFIVHAAALGTRMWIMGRPPVTNLYSSAVFIGVGAVLFGLVLEGVFPYGVGTAVGATIGGLSLIIAQHLAMGGETMEMLQAVLDTNFWLATHVTCVSAGYTATFVAGFLAFAYIGLRILTAVGLVPAKLPGGLDLLRMVAQMNYAVLCFATLFSFTGTVLGGIWADQSWGRFWGWDPKENGALLIVLWNVLILHARWGGIVKQAGMAVLSLGGNMVTGWSWFGTNQLGVGLHSYGFNSTLAVVLVGWWVLNLAVIGIGLVPIRFWQMFGKKPDDEDQPRRPPRGLR